MKRDLWTAARRELGAILDEGRGVPLWRDVAGTLRSSAAEPVWRAIDAALPAKAPPEGEIVLTVTAHVVDSLMAANSDMKRPRQADERAHIEKVRRLAEELRAAITDVMPAGVVELDRFELAARHDRPVVDVAIGWHRLAEDEFRTEYPLAVIDVLDWAVGAAERHRDRLPARSVDRSTAKHRTAFIRHLALRLAQHFNSEMHAAIATIVDALDANECGPTSIADVVTALKNRPSAFSQGA